jgi:two-component system, OmpR family, phosphate regulon sensor histidine kinase PhoR
VKSMPIRRMIYWLMPLIIAPMVCYTVYQIVQRNRQQALIQSIYRQQLDTILFSLNQNSWDRLNSWTNILSAVAGTDDRGSPAALNSLLTDFVARYRSVTAVAVYRDDQCLAAVEGSSTTDRVLPIDDGFIRNILTDSSQRIERMFELAAQNYVRPVAVSGPDRTHTLLLVPLRRNAYGARISAALLIDHRRYIEETAAVKIREMNNLFDFVVRDRRTGEIVYSSVEHPPDTFELSSPFWIFPDLQLQVKLRGVTLTALVRRQVTINWIFLMTVNGVLVLGVLFLLRNLAGEIRLAKQKTDFVANVSHELRTPLALIRMYAETLDMDRVPSPERKKEYFRTIMNESARLTRLINNILDFAKIDAQKKEYHFEELDLGAIVREVLEVYRSHLEQKGFVLQQEVAEGLRTVTADREAVIQALVNLLDNAVKYSGDEKRIIVRLMPDDGGLRLSVADRGIGIPAEEHLKIFEKFYRVESSLVHTTRGSGLGLTLVEHIMVVHRGRVEVQSRPGEGSVFTLVFPLKNIIEDQRLLMQ